MRRKHVCRKTDRCHRTFPSEVCEFALFSTLSWQVFGLCRLPTCSGFPASRPVPNGVFVPAYRCGAAPDSHRIPFSVSISRLKTP
jgi:hypothetical protein